MSEKLVALFLFIFCCLAFTAANKCPDGQFCPDTATCCQLASGKYGCCPHPNAVCCSDKIHCCPNGYKCDEQQKRCIKGITVIEATFMMPGETKEVADEMSRLQYNVSSKEDLVPCGGGQFCPDENTCCELASGQEGCCPMPNAVCCSDKQHCCPHGKRCDSTGQQCLSDNDVFDSTMLMPKQTKEEAMAWSHSMSKYGGSTPCPGGGSCPGEMTCCTLPSGEPGCCPYSQAVCCPDKLHCCPHGTHCDGSSTHCLNGDVAFDAALTMQIQPKLEEEMSNSILGGMGPCPGGGFCPDGSTCCPMQSGQQGCCPYSDAVCCKDKVHCCPHGTHCDATSTHCLSGRSMFQAALKMPSE